VPLPRSGRCFGPVYAATVLTAFVLIHADPDRIAALGAEIADVDGVAEVYSVTGDLDLVAIVRVRQHDELADVVTGHIAALPGIVHTTTMIAFRAYSRHDLESMFGLGIE
jgi:DNA-binding Lrp family transcriptional regulator